MKTLSWSVGIALLALAVCVPRADAEIVKCQRTIAQASSKFVQAKVKALSKCEESIVKGLFLGPCPDAKASASISKATGKLTAAIDKSCGGDDKVCGGNLTNEDTPASLGWPAVCPDFEHSPDAACTVPITDCGDIATCVGCVGETAVDQAIALYYDDLLASPPGSVVNKCQISIGKATSAFLGAKSKALQKCWDAKLNGKFINPLATCVPPNTGDDKYLAAIAKAEAKKIATICKACGGIDKLCGGGDDLTAAAIGFGLTCPAVTIPGGAACGGPINNLQDIVACVDCVTEFKADCVDRLQVPQYAAYPTECGVCVTPAPIGACPTSLAFTADGQNVDLDAGFKGLGHNAQVPTNGRLTLAVSGCAGGSNPTCGQCNVNGPLDNAGGITFDNHRCQDQPWVPCSANVDCTNAGATGPCIFFFGSPLPLVAGGVPTCILNEISGPVTGTININDGTSVTNVPLASKVHPVGGEFNPCPQCNVSGLECVAGTNAGTPCAVPSECPGGACVAVPRCTDGPRISKPCSVSGSSIQFGNVSLDCPPNPGSNAGTLSIALNIATGTQNATVSASNPKCRATGFTTLRCLCDTCNNINQQACSTDGDCPISGGNPGICGGRRCLGGLNDGAPCASLTECPGGGLCNRPGEETQPNSCLDDTSTPEVGCQDVGANEGLCPAGPVDLNCSIQKQHACILDSDCNPSLSCPSCLTGQICVAHNRSCFTDNGVVGNSVSVTGQADPPCGSVSKPTLGTLFCVAPVAASSVNAAGGLPGLGRVRIPGVVVINP